MVAANQSRRVLQAIVDCYPANGVIVGVSIQRGWGDIVNVAITTKPDGISLRSPDTGMRQEMRSGVEDALTGLPRIAVQFVEA